MVGQDGLRETADSRQDKRTSDVSMGELRQRLCSNCFIRGSLHATAPEVNLNHAMPECCLSDCADCEAVQRTQSVDRAATVLSVDAQPQTWLLQNQETLTQGVNQLVQANGMT